MENSPSASIAQLAEHTLRKRTVMGSIPSGGSELLRRFALSGPGRLRRMGASPAFGSVVSTVETGHRAALLPDGSMAQR